MNQRVQAISKLTALITGASSGLGEAFAKNLAGRGHNLVLVSEDGTGLERVKSEIAPISAGTITVITQDLFQPNSADSLVRYCDENGLQIDILVNCAGIFLNIDRELRSIGCVENAVNLHVMTVTKLCFLFGRGMVERGRGYILNISSIAAEFPDPASLTYGPTKRYILSFSEALHCEWKRRGVFVTCLTPGGIRTNFFKANNVYIPPIIRATLISADDCARIGINAMFKGTARVTPGIAGKIQSFFLKIISRPATYPLIKRTYFSMKNKTQKNG